MNPEDRLMAVLKRALRPAVRESRLPQRGRHTHPAGVCTAILSASAEHVIADKEVERKHLEEFVASAAVQDGDVHFAEVVGWWQRFWG